MIREEDSRNGILSLVGGDAERARQLRANIAVFARRLGDPHMSRMVNEVLAGHRNVREIFRSSQFQEVASRNVARIEEGLERLDPKDRERILGSRGDEPSGDQERLDALRDADLPNSPVDAWGEVEPEQPRPRPRH